jgi:hypothetical protein
MTLPSGPFTKQYIGDGVYVAIDCNDIVLTTEDGISVTNTVILEPQVLAALIEYLQRLAQVELHRIFEGLEP